MLGASNEMNRPDLLIGEDIEKGRMFLKNFAAETNLANRILKNAVVPWAK
jgi:hypothetical protein